MKLIGRVQYSVNMYNIILMPFSFYGRKARIPGMHVPEDHKHILKPNMCLNPF